MNKGISFIQKQIEVLKDQVKWDKDYTKEEPQNPKEQSTSGKFVFNRIRDNTKLIESLELIINTAIYIDKI